MKKILLFILPVLMLACGDLPTGGSTLSTANLTVSGKFTSLGKGVISADGENYVCAYATEELPAILEMTIAKNAGVAVNPRFVITRFIADFSPQPSYGGNMFPGRVVTSWDFPLIQYQPFEQSIITANWKDMGYAKDNGSLSLINPTAFADIADYIDVMQIPFNFKFWVTVYGYEQNGSVKGTEGWFRIYWGETVFTKREISMCPGDA